MAALKLTRIGNSVGVILPKDMLVRLKVDRSEEHTSELQSQSNLVCRLLLEKKKVQNDPFHVRHIIDLQLPLHTTPAGPAHRFELFRKVAGHARHRSSGSLARHDCVSIAVA